MTRTIKVYDENGKQLESFKFNLDNIHNVQHYLNGFWSYEPFNEALTGRIKFSDVDGQVEANGHTLNLEFKNSLFSMNQGQAMKAVRQARFQKTSTFFIEGKQDEPRYLLKVNPTGMNGEFHVSDLIKADVNEIRQHITEWQKWTFKNSLVKGKRTEDWEAVKYIIDRCHEIRK
jgi:hypothetical protein